MAASDTPTIFVLEDGEALRSMLVRVLTDAGFQTYSTGSAYEGLDMVRRLQGKLTLAILDMMLPGMSGLDLACEFDREFPDLKILYISGYVDSVAAQVLAHRAPEQVLLKPFGPAALLERVSLLSGVVMRRGAQSAPEAPPIAGSGTLG